MKTVGTKVKKYTDYIHLWPLWAILILGAVMLLYRPEHIPFFGDIGWFYLSARDMILTGNVPLVSITSSHTWLHQGPLWTYMLAAALWLGKFHPLSGVMLSIGIGITTIIAIYKIGMTLFSQRVGMVAALLYATSPLVILHARMPYHTTPIPLASIVFFYCMYQWMKGKKQYFMFIPGLVAILYNLELATVILGGVFGVILVHGYFKKKSYIKSLDKKTVSVAIVGFLIIMSPVIIYDTTHGFAQTVKFMAWMVYKAVRIPFQGVGDGSTVLDMIPFFALYYRRLIFLASGLVSFTIFICSFIWFLNVFVVQLKRNTIHLSYLLLFLWIFIPLVSFFVNKTPSEAYLPLLFPPIMLLTAVWLVSLAKSFITQSFVVGIVLLIAGGNTYTLLQQNYLMGRYGYGPTYQDRLEAVEKIIQSTNGKAYNIYGRGNGSQFASYTMTYEYLAWWKGNAPTNNTQATQFVIQEYPEKVTIQQIR